MSDAIWTLFAFACCFVGACGFFLIATDKDIERARQARRERLMNRQRALRYWVTERRGEK